MKKHIWLFLAILVLMIALPAVSLIGPAPSPQAHASEKDKDNAQTPTTEKLKLEGFKVLDKSSGKVLKVSEKDYVIGAVASEMPATFHTEALKAQVVAAHTYAVRLREQQREKPTEALKGADFEADPSNFQGFLTESAAKARFGENFDSYWKKISDAVESVYTEILVYEDQPIVAAYHSMSGGKTEAAENVWGNATAYLKPVDSEGDKLAPEYQSTASFPAADVKAALQKADSAVALGDDASKWFGEPTRSDSGTITSIPVGGKTWTGAQVRTALNLRSANFTVSYTDGNFTFTTLGYGHGVGLSQYGADYMARQGKTYKEILLHYYSGAALQTLQ